MKKGWLIFGILVLVLFLIGAFFYMSLVKPINSSPQNLVNPSKDLSIDETKQQFDESFVYYLLASIDANALHNPPLSGDTPKIEILIGNKTYSAVIDKGNIQVNDKTINNPDIRISTTLDEAAQMVKYPEYVQKSFSDGKSSIALIAGKTTLFSKGYLNLYTQVTGKSITGNVIRIYTS